MVAALVLLPTAGLAQDTPPADAPKWVKICGTDPNAKKEFCLVTQELYADTGRFIASAALRQTTGDPKITLVAAVPLGMLLQPGLRAQVDQGKQYELKYSICFPNACYGDVEVNDELVKAMKAGGQLTITTLNQQGKTIAFPLTLVGFTKVFDGEGVDPAAGQAQLDDLSKTLKEHAEQARRKLIEQQQQSSN